MAVEYFISGHFGANSEDFNNNKKSVIKEQHITNQEEKSINPVFLLQNEVNDLKIGPNDLRRP